MSTENVDSIQVESIGEAAPEQDARPIEGATSEPAPEAETSDAADDAAESEDSGREKRDRFGERISTLVAQRKEAEARAQKLEAEREAMRVELERARRGEPEPYDPRTPPDPSEYVHGENDAEFMRDLGKHEAYRQFHQEQRQTVEQAAFSERVTIATRLADVMATTEGYEAGAEYLQKALSRDPSVSFSPVLIEAVATQPDVAAEILSYLAENEGAIEAFHALPPVQQALWVGRQAALLSGSQDPDPPEPQQPSRRVSNAPAPPPRVRGGAGAANPYEADGEFVSVKQLNAYAEGRR